MCAFFSRISVQANSWPHERADPPVELVVERRGTARGRSAATAAACAAISASSAANSVGPNRAAATRTVSTSSAVRTKRACCTACSEMALTSVERCGRMVRKPSCDSRQKASRTGCRDTPAARATSTSDSRAPGGSASVTTCS